MDFELHCGKHQGIREQAEYKVTTAKEFKRILETQLITYKCDQIQFVLRYFMKSYKTYMISITCLKEPQNSMTC